jgi:hypothetical protein
MKKMHDPWRAARGAAWAVAVAAAVAACGGKDGGGAREPAAAADEPYEPDVMIPEHRWVEIEHLFERRRPIISRCFSQAIDAGELSDDDTGYLTIGLTITEEGRAVDLEISESTLDSKHLHDCALTRVSEWDFGPLPRSTPYSFSYQLETL